MIFRSGGYTKKNRAGRGGASFYGGRKVRDGGDDGGARRNTTGAQRRHGVALRYAATEQILSGGNRG